MTKTAPALLKIAMDKHGITWPALTERVERDEKLDRATAETLVDRFKDGGPCAVVVGAAIIYIIAESKVTS